jgi:hypothetical protein
MDLYRPFFDNNVTPENKKYSVWVMKDHEPKLIHFGDRNMQHYYDSTDVGLWHSLDHLDPKRRRSYRARASGIRDKKNKATYKDRNSANYWSYHYLW